MKSESKPQSDKKEASMGTATDTTVGIGVAVGASSVVSSPAAQHGLRTLSQDDKVSRKLRAAGVAKPTATASTRTTGSATGTTATERHQKAINRQTERPDTATSNVTLTNDKDNGSAPMVQSSSHQTFVDDLVGGLEPIPMQPSSVHSVASSPAAQHGLQTLSQEEEIAGKLRAAGVAKPVATTTTTTSTPSTTISTSTSSTSTTSTTMTERHGKVLARQAERPATSTANVTANVTPNVTNNENDNDSAPLVHNSNHQTFMDDLVGGLEPIPMQPSSVHSRASQQPSRPGAYVGQTFQRVESLNFELVGAYSDHNSNYFKEASDVFSVTAPTRPSFAHGGSSAGLVEARAVFDESKELIFQEAQQVDVAVLEEQQLRRSRQQQKKLKLERTKEENPNGHYRKVGLAVLLCSIVILAISLGVGLKSKQDTAADTDYEPSQVPSLAPTSVLDVLLMELLPSSTLARMNNGSDTPQWKAWQWLSHHQNVTNFPDWRLMQLFALATFFYAMEGPHWPDNIQRTWMNEEIDECMWFSSEFGAFDANGKYIQGDERFGKDGPCNPDGKYQSLILQDLRLAGKNPTVPPEIALLTDLSVLALPFNQVSGSLDGLLPFEFLTDMNLKSLVLHSNDLSGEIPSEMWNLTSLIRLALNQNSFIGTIPSELGRLTHMRDIYLHTNGFYGSLPTELALLTSTTLLHVGSNSLSGPIPSELWSMKTMESLSLSKSSFSGFIPSQVGLLTSMEFMRMDGNSLSGALPSELGLLTNMTTFTVASNSLSGFVPSELGLWANMTQLSLSQNWFTGPLPSEIGLLTATKAMSLWGNSLTSALPSQIGMLSSMEIMNLYANLFTGSMPTELGLMPNMTSFRVYQNSFHGALPSELGLLVSMESLRISENAFTGLLPSEIGLLTKLTGLNGGSNLLSGSLPSEIGLLTQLTVLNLRSNSFDGYLPSQLGLLTQLLGLWLPSCRFSGSIPSELGMMESLKLLNLRNNTLSGPVVSELGQLDNLQELDLSSLPLLSGSFPFDVFLSKKLSFLDISGSPGLEGMVTDEMCSLQSSSCSYEAWWYGGTFPCSLDFDCSNLLCGCDCGCSNAVGGTGLRGNP